MADQLSPENVQTLVTLLSLGSNVALVTTAVKIVKNLARMELKVDTMWGVFMRRFGTREGEEGKDKDE
jgi:hypothetical protein